MASSTDVVSKFTLYYDDFCPDMSNAKEISVTKETVQKAHETICQYFDVVHEWDKKLFESVFTDDSAYNRFKFSRVKAPEKYCVIKTDRNREAACSKDPEEFEALDRGNRLINVLVKSSFGNEDYFLAQEELNDDWKTDLSIIALYNSESFTKQVKYIDLNNSDIKYRRTYEVLDPNHLIITGE